MKERAEEFQNGLVKPVIMPLVIGIAIFIGIIFLISIAFFIAVTTSIFSFGNLF